MANRYQFDTSAAFAEREKMRAKAKAEGATILEIPTADQPGARNEGKLAARDVATVAQGLADAADELRRQHPEIIDDTYIRAAIVTQWGDDIMEDFIRAYPAIFHNFTSREFRGDTRERMLQTIAVKARLEEGKLTTDNAHNLLSDCFGVDAAKRAEIRSEMERMNKN